LEESKRNFAVSCLLRSRWHARGHGRTRDIARPARCLSALGLSVVAMSCKAFRSSSFRCCWSCANAAVSAALTCTNKKARSAFAVRAREGVPALASSLPDPNARGPHRISGDTTLGARCTDAASRPVLRSM